MIIKDNKANSDLILGRGNQSLANNRSLSRGLDNG